MKFKDLSLSKKFTYSFGLVLLLLLLGTMFPILSSVNVKGKIASLNDSIIPQNKLCADVKLNTLWAMYELLGYTFGRSKKAVSSSYFKSDESDQQKAFAYLDNSKEALNKLLAEANSQNKAVIDSLKFVIEEYERTAYESGNTGTKMESIYDELVKSKDKFISDMEDLSEQQISREGNASKGAARTVKLIIETIRLLEYALEYINSQDVVNNSLSKISDNINIIKQQTSQSNLIIDAEKMLENFVDNTKLYYQTSAVYNQVNSRTVYLGKQIVAGASKVEATAYENTMNLSGTVKDTSEEMVLSLIICIIVLMILCLIQMRFITASTLKPIKKATVEIEKIASGDLTNDIVVDGHDETGHMIEKVNDMTHRIRKIVADIKNGANYISQSSLEMSKTSQTMSRGAVTQASSAEEVSSSIEEMSAGIQQNSENARETELIAIKALENIKQSSQAGVQTMDAMRDIANKISIIDEIAFQTNILALNAAVEAARAGEQGKGFAVVASEVRKLAERSAVAANEIDKVSKEGVSISENASNLLISIIPDIEKTANLVREIAAASTEQSGGIEQINKAVQLLNKITQEYAASAEEMASTSQSMAAQSESLRQSIDFFKVDDNNSNYDFDNNSSRNSYKRIEDNSVRKPFDVTVARPTNTIKSGKGTVINMRDNGNDSDYERF